MRKKEKKYLGLKVKKVLGIFFILSFLNSFILFTPILFADSLGFNSARATVEDHTDPGLSSTNISNSASDISAPKATTQYTSPAGPMAPAGYQAQQAPNVYTSPTGNPLIDSFNQFQNYKNTPVGANVPIVFNPSNNATSVASSGATSPKTYTSFGTAMGNVAGKMAEPYVVSAKGIYATATNPSMVNTVTGALKTANSYLEKAKTYAASQPIKLPDAGAPIRAPQVAAAPAIQPLAIATQGPAAIAMAPKNQIALTPNPIPSYKPTFAEPYKTAVLPRSYTIPNYTKPELVKINTFAPTFTSTALIKPQTIQLGLIKPLNSPFDANLTQMPQLATAPKFAPIDFSAVKKLDLIKIKQAEPIKITLGQSEIAFNKDLKPVFNSMKNPIALPISQPTLIKPQWVKLDSSLNQAIKPVLPKIAAISPIPQLTPLKPTFNAITQIKPIQLPFDSKLTKAPAPVLIPMPKFDSFGYNALAKPNFTMIKQPEPIKPMALEKINPYIIKEAGMLSSIKPKFESFAPTLAAKPQWIKLAELNSAIKPKFTKIGQATPTLTQLVPLKPQWATIGTIKPLDMRVDANLTKIPQLANTMPKFVSVDFNAVKAPGFIKLNQTEAAKVALTQLNPALDKDLKTVFMPIKNQTISVNQIVLIKPDFAKLSQVTPTLNQPVSIKPEWIKTTEIAPAIKPEFSRLKETTLPLPQPVTVKPQLVTLASPQTIKPEIKALTMLIQTPMPEPVIVKPETIKVDAQNLTKVESSNNILGFEKILLQQIAPLSAERLVLPEPIKINPVINQELPVPQNVLTESIKAPTPVLAPVNLANVMPKAQTVSAKTENILLNSAKINTVPSINITNAQITKNNSLQQLAALKPASLVDNYMQQLKTIYEWKKMHNELVYLSQNAEAITANEAPVELADINAKITKIKASLDKKAGEVKEILAKNLVEQSILDNSAKTTPVSNFPFKDMPVNNTLPQPQLPIDRNLPLNSITLPNVLPRIEGGFMQNLREAFKGNVFALSTDYIEPTTGPDLDNSPRLRNQSPPR